MYTSLLGLDGATSVGRDNQIYRIRNEDRNLVLTAGQIEEGWNSPKETYSCVGPDKSIDGEYMMSSDWKRRVSLFIQRFWQPTSACMTCMPGSWGNFMSLAHWTIALQTGLLTGILAVLLTFTPAAKLYANRSGNALVVAFLTMLGDAYSHANHYGIPFAEAVVTGVISGLLTLAGSYLFEDRARRLRAAWTRIFG
jgi:hypothetical protein